MYGIVCYVLGIELVRIKTPIQTTRKSQVMQKQNARTVCRNFNKSGNVELTAQKPLRLRVPRALLPRNTSPHSYVVIYTLPSSSSFLVVHLVTIWLPCGYLWSMWLSVPYITHLFVPYDLYSTSHISTYLMNYILHQLSLQSLWSILYMTQLLVPYEPHPT